MTAATALPCPCKCRGGRDCVCAGEHPHTQHICSKATCVCHQPDAFGLEPELRQGIVWRYVRVSREGVQR